jgi:hypothetical protein
MQKAIFITLNLLSFGISPAFAASEPSCKQIDQAISANEDFVEVALGIDDLPLPPALQTIKTTYGKVEPSLSQASRGFADAEIKKVEKNMAEGDLPMAAVAAIENYKVLVAAFDKRLPTTLDTAMLDYAGFKLLSQTAAKTLDWTGMAQTVEGSKINWEKTKALMKDQGVIDLVDSVHVGMQAALLARNVPWLGFSAQVLLDSVDLIERNSPNPAKGACS